MDPHGRCVGLNEALFREVNNRLRELTETFGPREGPQHFICECGDARCAERIEMTLAEYEALRSDPTHFAVRHGHETQDVESVVADHSGFVTIRKRRGAPADLARELDPRPS